MTAPRLTSERVREMLADFEKIGIGTFASLCRGWLAREEVVEAADRLADDVDAFSGLCIGGPPDFSEDCEHDDCRNVRRALKAYRLSRKDSGEPSPTKPHRDPGCEANVSADGCTCIGLLTTQPNASETEEARDCEGETR